MRYNVDGFSGRFFLFEFSFCCFVAKFDLVYDVEAIYYTFLNCLQHLEIFFETGVMPVKLQFHGHPISEKISS